MTVILEKKQEDMEEARLTAANQSSPIQLRLELEVEQMTKKGLGGW